MVRCESRRKRRKKKLLTAAAVLLFSFSLFGVKVEAKRIYTGNVRVDAAAEKIIRKCTRPEMSRKKKLRSVYTYLVKHMSYSRRPGRVRVKVTPQQKKRWKAQEKQLRRKGKVRYSGKFSSVYDNLLTLQGTCKDMSGVMCIMANHLGYKAGYHVGRYVRSNGHSSPHWWNYVIVNGQRRYFDVQAANHSWSKHHSMAAVRSFGLRRGNSRGWRRHHRG